MSVFLWMRDGGCERSFDQNLHPFYLFSHHIKEQFFRIKRPGMRLWMILHRNNIKLFVLKSFDRAIVGILLRDQDLFFIKTRFIHSIPMVLRRDMHDTSLKVLNWLVGSAVSEFHFI